MSLGLHIVPRRWKGELGKQRSHATYEIGIKTNRVDISMESSTWGRPMGRSKVRAERINELTMVADHSVNLGFTADNQSVQWAVVRRSKLICVWLRPVFVCLHMCDIPTIQHYLAAEFSNYSRCTTWQNKDLLLRTNWCKCSYVW